MYLTTTDQFVAEAKKDEVKRDGEAGARSRERMLKWLLAGAPSRQNKPAVSTEVVTDDPLALICTHEVDRPLEIYAVSRSVVGLSDYGNEHVYLKQHLYLTCQNMNPNCPARKILQCELLPIEEIHVLCFSLVIEIYLTT